MTITTELDGGKNGMRHCDTCRMSQVVDTERNGDNIYTQLQHVFIRARECVQDPSITELTRAVLEAEGYGDEVVFDVALQCLRCAEGLCLISQSGEEHQGNGFAV